MKNRLVVFLLLLLLLAVSCRKKDRYVLKDDYVDKPAYGDTLVDSSIGEPICMDPVLASDNASFNIIGMVFNALLKYDKDLKLTGDLAEKWAVAPDGKTISFYLKKGIKWHDGFEFTSADVKFTYDKFMDPGVKTAYRGLFELIAGIDTPDKYTVVVRYKKPYAPALNTWAGTSIIPEHLLKGRDLNTDGFNRNPVGTGPYRFKKWVTAQSVELYANKDYFEGEPYISNYICRTIPDQSVQLMEITAGSIDSMILTSDMYFTSGDTVEFKKNYNKFKIKAPQYIYMGFNLKNSLFADKNVRKALSYAINKDDIINGVKRGLAEHITGPFMPGTWAYNDKAEPYAYDLERSKALLKKAGWIAGKDGYLYRDGVQFAFTIMTNQNKEREVIATIIQQQLNRLGIKVEVRVLAWNIFITDKVDKHNFDAIIMGWGTGRDPDCYEIWNSSKIKEGEFNFISYGNLEVDRLLEEGRTTFDQAKRAKIYRRIHEVIADDAPYVFLYMPYDLPVYHKRFHGIKEEKAGIGYNSIKWYVPAEIQKYRVSPTP